MCFTSASPLQVNGEDLNKTCMIATTISLPIACCPSTIPGVTEDSSDMKCGSVFLGEWFMMFI
jgi:hypothetical protein